MPLYYLEYSAIIFNLIYLVLAIRGNKYCWPVSIVGVILSYIVYIHPTVALYSDATLQLFYFAISIHGWISWKRAEAKGEDFQIRVMQLPQHIAVLLIGILGTFMLGAFWSHFDGSYPYWDAATTSFAIITTYLVTQRYLDNWLYWIVIDTACAVLYYLKDLNGFFLLFVLYTLMAVWGYFKWKSKYRMQRAF